MGHAIRVVQGFLAICLCMALQPATAAPLNLVPGPQEFDLAIDQTITYNSTTGELTITGTVGTFTNDNGTDDGPVTSDPGTGVTELFDMSVFFNTSTGALVSGEFQIDGVVRDLTTPTTIYHTSAGDPGGLLSSSSFVEFGIANVGGETDEAILEFTFNNGDGAIADLYGGVGGMILRIDTGTTFFDAETTFEDAYFLQDWSGTLVSGSVFVPVPAAVWLFLSGLAGLLGVARRRKTV
jgi:hypothetical protein